MSIKHELQNIISGNGSVGNGKVIQSINEYIRREKKAVSNLAEGEFNKNKETQILKGLISHSNLWYSGIDDTKYIGEGEANLLLLKVFCR